MHDRRRAAQPPFQVGARINAGGHMTLDVEAVATVVFTLGMPEMVEAGAKQAGQRCEGANVAAQVAPVDGVVAGTVPRYPQVAAWL